MVSDGTSKRRHVQEPHRQRDALSDGPSEAFRLGTLGSGTLYHVITVLAATNFQFSTILSLILMVSGKSGWFLCDK